jgi:hypothetical protein
MMKTWKGIYRFEKAPEALLSKSVKFEMHIAESDGSFSGKFIDEEYAKLCEHEPKVSGFFEENYASFVVVYPFRRVYKEDGTPVLITDFTDQEVTYYGEFEEDSTNKILGSWEIIFETHIGTQGVNLVAASGPFEMSDSIKEE